MSVNKILDLGDDALLARWGVIFPNGLPGGGNTEAISLRIDKPFDPPAEGVGTYLIHYKGLKILKTNTTESGDKTFTLEARIDQKWEVADAIEKTMIMTHNRQNGTALPDSMTRFPVIIVCYDGQDNIEAQFLYDNCKLRERKFASFDHASEEPQQATMTFIYGSSRLEF